jgi:acyl-CoA synthetase (AMP-forming)/AMP-acid ligase II
MRSASEFSDRMAAHVAEMGDKAAMVYVADPESSADAESLTYRELHDAACRVGALLQGQVRAGDRVMLMYPPGLPFAIGFLGCLYAGVVPVAVPLPDGQRHRNERLAAIARNAGVAALLTEGASIATVTQWAAKTQPAGLPCIATDGAGLPEAGQWRTPSPDPDRIAFLQYTSGSTSDPRGVVVTVANLAENAQVFQRITGVGADARHGGWVPMYHDMGLIGLFLAPLYLGHTAVHMSPSVFLRHPQSWLRLVDRFDLQVSPAPNFAYEMCVRRVEDRHLYGLDLSRWRVAMNGAEPIRAATIRDFLARFGPYGLRPDALSPGYGLAEATLAVCAAGLGHPPRFTVADADRLALGELRPVPSGETHQGARELVGCGPVTDFDLRIVDPSTRRVLADGRVGEIWLRGPSVARGYWRAAEATAATFAAVTAEDDGGFLRTGDLGVRQDGELYITGRIKEILIVNGRNLYPQDLEAEARLAHATLAGGVGAAFSVAVPEEQIVLVHEVRLGRDGKELLPGIAGAVRRQLAREFGISASVLLVRSGAVHRTTSGKIQRVAVRAEFLRRALSPVHSELTPEVRAYLERVGEPDPVPAGAAR